MVKWVSSLTPRILGVLFNGVTSYNALTLKCIHIKECVRRFNTPIDDRMSHLNDGLYMSDTKIINDINNGNIFYTIVI